MELTSEFKCLACSWSDHLHYDTPREWIACPICGFNVVLIQRIPETLAIREARKEHAGLSLTDGR
jgi:DNA-directed RNA polymerase subunit RPC12/RpoP